MPKKPFVDFRDIRSRITMEQVLQHYGVLHTFKRTGDRLSGPCPIHKGTNPTQFRVETEKNVWHCFSECKHGGNVLDFIAKMEDINIHDAALKACEWFGIPIEEVKTSSRKAEVDEPEETPERPAKTAPEPAAKSAPNGGRPQGQPQDGDSPQDGGRAPAPPNKPLGFKLDKLQREHPYLLEDRGLTPSTIAEFGLGYFTGDKGLMVGRIVIPIHNVNGELVAYAGRWPGEPPDAATPKYKLPPNFRKSLELFNADRAFREPADKPLVIVEGFFDAIKLHQNGWRKVVALMGSTMSHAQEELIRKHTDGRSHVIAMLDKDEAGRFGSQDIAMHLSRFCFVKTHVFDEPNTQPEQLSAEDLVGILEGVL